ncbi:MAG: 2-oxo acid dehydrogenase subunit E2, partial [Spirochaetaceae bacterium]|nr:2-oxo acid dehydrogenase subunit E2 [Spirochaetaceae bacterium]
MRTSGQSTPSAGDAPATPPPSLAVAAPAPGPATGKHASPRAKKLAQAKGLDWKLIAGTGPGGRVVEKDIQAALQGRQPLSPAALAGLAAGGLQAPAAGSGPGGRVLLRDLARSAGASGIPAVDITNDELKKLFGGFPGPVDEVPVKGVRKVIAERMLYSLQNHAQLTLCAPADARVLQDFRKKLKASHESLGLSGITLNDCILYAVSRVLPRHPELNAHWTGGSILRFHRVHLAFAVDTPRGLLVPVIRNADLLSLKQISVEAKRLAAACIEGKASPEDLAGGTFTVSNLGAFGVESFTPILNTPQAAILGVGTISPKPFMENDEVKFVPALALSLTI